MPQSDRFWILRNKPRVGRLPILTNYLVPSRSSALEASTSLHRSTRASPLLGCAIYSPRLSCKLYEQAHVKATTPAECRMTEY